MPSSQLGARNVKLYLKSHGIFKPLEQNAVPVILGKLPGIFISYHLLSSRKRTKLTSLKMNVSHPSQYFSLVVNIMKKRHFAHIHTNTHTHTYTILLSLLECGFYIQDFKLCHYALDSLLGASHLSKGLSLLSQFSLSRQLLRSINFAQGWYPLEFPSFYFSRSVCIVIIYVLYGRLFVKVTWVQCPFQVTQLCIFGCYNLFAPLSTVFPEFLAQKLCWRCSYWGWSLHVLLISDCD